MEVNLFNLITSYNPSPLCQPTKLQDLKIISFKQTCFKILKLIISLSNSRSIAS